MKTNLFLILLLILSVLLVGCQADDFQDPAQPEVAAPTEAEPTAVYDWMAGESPVPVKRMGIERSGVERGTVSPTGTYFLCGNVPGDTPAHPVILYMDHGSDVGIKLCGRPDCTHETTDCNAYVKGGSHLTYHDGYLYAISGGYDDQDDNENCKLIRMDPDGTDRVELYDFRAFAKENGADYAHCQMITEGYLIFATAKWVSTGENTMEARTDEVYLYKLDGSMEIPQVLKNDGWILHNCGDVTLTYFPTSENGGSFGSYWDWDPTTDSLTFLTDHPGQPGYFAEEEAYYFKDGAICRLTYETQEEEILVQTGLDGDYMAIFLPDCIVLVSDAVRQIEDKNLYFYNWDFQLVDTVQIPCPEDMFMVRDAIMAETAERIFLTDQTSSGIPSYYIDKSELGTGDLALHRFQLIGMEGLMPDME